MSRGRAPAAPECFVEIRSKCANGEFTILSKIETQAAGDLLHRLIWAAPPTRDTELPTLMAGRMPR